MANVKEKLDLKQYPEITKEGILIREENGKDKFVTNNRTIFLKVIDVAEDEKTTANGKKLKIFNCLDRKGNKLKLQAWDGEIKKIKIGKEYAFWKFYPTRYEGEIKINKGIYGFFEEFKEE